MEVKRIKYRVGMFVIHADKKLYTITDELPAGNAFVISDLVDGSTRLVSDTSLRPAVVQPNDLVSMYGKDLRIDTIQTVKTSRNIIYRLFAFDKGVLKSYVLGERVINRILFK